MNHPHIRFRYNDPTFCHYCGGDTHPVKYTHAGHICSDCRTECAWCESWLMGESIEHNGKRMHAACALEAMDAEKEVA
jgi:hypothetical protein